MISVVIPTMWRANQFLFPMLQYLDLVKEVGEVIIIDNDKQYYPDSLMDYCRKISYYENEKNIYFNPSVNLGFSLAKHDIVCILNDDVIFDPRIFKYISENMTEDMGLVTPLSDYFNKPLDGEFDYSKLFMTSIIQKDGFGCVMFLHKKNFVEIPSELTQHFGDAFMLATQVKNGRENFTLHNWNVYTPMRVTTFAVPEIVDIIKKDWSVALSVFEKNGLPAPFSPWDSPITSQQGNQ